MIITLNSRKHISPYRNQPIYIGEQNFDEISVFLPQEIDGNISDELTFILHLVNKYGDYLLKTLVINEINNKKVGSTVVTADLTAISQVFDVYIEMKGNNGEIIGKTNTLPIEVHPLPDEENRILPPDQKKEIEDRLTALESKVEVLSDSLHFKIVNELPTEDIDENAIYLVPKEEPTENYLYNKFVYINNNWESFGGAIVDLSDYYTKTEIDNKGFLTLETLPIYDGTVV